MTRTMSEQFDRDMAAYALRHVRGLVEPKRLSPWDTCVVAGTNAKADGHLREYAVIRAVAVKFRPTTNPWRGRQ